MLTVFFWVVSCSYVRGYLRFEGAYSYHLTGRLLRISSGTFCGVTDEARQQKATRSVKLVHSSGTYKTLFTFDTTLKCDVQKFLK
jgi:hypothetical protein